MTSPLERITRHLRITEEIALAIRALALDEDAVYGLAQDLANRLRLLSCPKQADGAWVAALEAATGTAVEFINWCALEADEGSLRAEGVLVAFALGELRATASDLYEEAGLSGTKPRLFSLDPFELGVTLIEQSAEHWLRLCELFRIPVKKEWAEAAAEARAAEAEEAEREAERRAAQLAERTDEWYAKLTATVAHDALERGEPITASTVQRRYGVGYIIACRVLDALEASGCAEVTRPERGWPIYRILRQYP